jgi:hypothetical protein
MELGKQFACLALLFAAIPGRSAEPGDLWSLRPIHRPAVPQILSLQSSIRNPIDRFILAKLAEMKLQASAEGDRRTLIRRLSFDLLGLPPDAKRIEEFINDPRPDAYERLVDEMLASPAYGERWARHWLDVVHYGETHGYDKDKPRPNAWPYRDYVIRALNADKPYARFVQEQLAGDVLFPNTLDGREALGFIAAGPWDFIGHAELPETKIDGQIARHLDRDDMVGNAIGTFMSLTIQCAQCHDHKFDPITQADYYRLQAVFAAVDRADLRYDVDPVVTQRRCELVAELVAGFPGAWNELAKLPLVHVVYAGIVHHGTGTFLGTGANGGKPRTIHIHKRGDVTKPGVEVGPGPIASVSNAAGLPVDFELPANHREGDRRVALAKWITHPDNPLTWRSIVNRVWQYHFGRGLVDTPNDFGKMGQKPSHPELLDWLAGEFRDGGGSLKQLHRLIVTSATYRQSSRMRNAELGMRNEDSSVPHSAFRIPQSVDPNNVFLSHMNRRKLEAEEIRDAVLATAGRLDRAMGGPSYQDFVVEQPEHSPHYEYQKADPDDPRTHRRSIYRFIVRSQPQPFMTTLDCADPSMRVDKRNESLSPVQALTLLNNGFMLTMSRHFAERVTAAPDPAAAAYRLAFGRAPTEAEREKLTAFAREHGLPNACRVLLNLNEFAFVD